MTDRDDMPAEAALRECYDLWASGAWPDANATYNLEEVMLHLERLFGIELTEHPEHTECADGCGLDVKHDGPCRERPGGRIVCNHEN